MTLCLSGIRHDIRLMRQLNAFELRHFLILLDYASDRRDPTFIPAKKREEVRLILGFGSGEGRERLEKRLRRWEELDLIQIGEDNSILINYRLDQLEAEEEESYPSAALYSHGLSGNGPITGNGSNGNGNGLNGNDSLANGASGRRQSGRTYSTDPEAVRQRERRWRLAQASGEGGGRDTNSGRDILQNVTENVTPAESKRHAMTATFEQQMSQGDVTENVAGNRDMSVTSLARASDVLTSSRKEDNKIISDSYDVKDVQNVAAGQTSQNVTGQNVASLPSATSLPGDRPPLRPGFERIDLEVQRQKDVDAVLAITRDVAYRKSWPKVWNHCQAHGALSCWDEAILVLQGRMKRSAGEDGYLPPSAYGASLRTTMQNKLRDFGYPMEQGTPEDRAETQAQIRASMLTAEAASAEPVGSGLVGPAESPPGGSGITPLDSIYTEEDTNG